MNGIVMLALRAPAYLSKDVVERMDAINSERERLSAQWDSNEAAAGEMITAANANAETIERKAKARFIRVEIINKLLQQVDLALAWTNPACAEAGKEYSRYVNEDIPEAKAKVRADLLSIGFDEEFVRCNDSLHPHVFALTKQMNAARDFEVGGIPSWRRQLRQERCELEKIQKDAVRRVC